MCESCDEELGEKIAIDRALVERARNLEAGQIGLEPIPDSAWEIFAGASGGGIAWAHYQRMQTRYDQVFAAEQVVSALRRKPRKGRMMRCEMAAV
jgi:hypothetical protein